MIAQAQPADWILATTNPGKLSEYRELLAGTPITLEALDPASGAVPEESGATFVENALIKARHACRVSNRPAMADDSGLCVTALTGAPGVHSARYAGSNASDRDNLERLLSELSGIEPARRDAVFHCVIVALEHPDDPAPVIATGQWRGRIATAPRGKNGFGYDPVFYVLELEMTAAELPSARKNAISHRARACAELRRQLEV
jgi:XTP/dITP diphosphohydrolase